MPHPHSFNEFLLFVVFRPLWQSRCRLRSHAGFVPALLRGLAAAAPFCKSRHTSSAAAIDPFDCVLRQLAEKHALYRIHGLSTKFATAGMAQIKLFLGPCHAHKSEPPLFFQFVVASNA